MILRNTGGASSLEAGIQQGYASEKCLCAGGSKLLLKLRGRQCSARQTDYPIETMDGVSERDVIYLVREIQLLRQPLPTEATYRIEREDGDDLIPF